jgi:hypothetical protein
MGQQKRKGEHGDQKRRKITNTSPMGEVGGNKKTVLMMLGNCV